MAFAPPAVFDAKEQKVLLTLVDAYWSDMGEEEAEAFAKRHLARGNSAQHADLVAFARRSGSDSSDVIKILSARVGGTPPHDIVKLHLILKALATPVGCLALTGKRGPLFRLDNSTVQGIVKNHWYGSPLPAIRELGKAFKLLTACACFGANDTDVAINWRGINYNAPDLKQMRLEAKGPCYDYNQCRVDVPKPLGDTDRVFEVIADCVIVGSGPGGSVMAAELTEAGYKVVMLETGRWQPMGEQGASELTAQRHLYQEAGNFFTEGRGMTILAGSALGGGGAVNWSCCLPPTQACREEWARDYGLDWAAGAAMEESVQKAKERLSMHSEGVPINKANQVLMQGCQKLGYQAEVAAQQGWQSTDQDGGLCSAGWKQGARQGMHASALLDAAQTGRFQLLDGCTAHRVLTDVQGTACGVQGTLRDADGSTRSVLVRGKIIVAAGGALQTPLLLRRSGLKNKNIGRNLRLHPALTIWGKMPEQVKFFEGAPMTTVSRVAEDLDGKGYGSKIWVPNFHPITWSVLQPWQGPQEYKDALAGYATAAPLITLVRDTGSGKVWEDKNQRVRASYSMNATDKDHLQTGVDHAARILVAAGACEVHSAHNVIEPLVLDSTKPSEPQLEAWLARIRKEGFQEHQVALGSAHQMGTCRMSSSSKQGAAKPTGETWEVPGLYVADTSAFPTASGVNPMWTCAAIAHHVAQQVKTRLAETTELRQPCSALRGVGVAGCAAVAATEPGALPETTRRKTWAHRRATVRSYFSRSSTTTSAMTELGDQAAPLSFKKSATRGSNSSDETESTSASEPEQAGEVRALPCV